MSPDYTSKTVDILAARQAPARGSAGGEIVMGRVLRAGSRPPTPTATYHDIIVLGADLAPVVVGKNETRDIVAVLSDVACPASVTVTVGAVVTVKCFQPRARIVAGFEPLSGDYDIQSVLSGNAVILSSGGGGGVSSIADWGVLAD